MKKFLVGYATRKFVYLPGFVSSLTHPTPARAVYPMLRQCFLVVREIMGRLLFIRRREPPESVI